MKLVDENGEISKHDLIIQVFELLLNPAKWKKYWIMIVIYNTYRGNNFYKSLVL